MLLHSTNPLRVKLSASAVGVLVLFTSCLTNSLHADQTLSNFNGTGFGYTFGDFTQTIGSNQVRLTDTIDGWGGAGSWVGQLNLSGDANSRFVVDFTPEVGNVARDFTLELIDNNANTGKWNFYVDSLPQGVPTSLTSTTVLANPTDGIGDWMNLDLSQITSWQVLGDFDSPAPFDISFDNIEISSTAPAPLPYAGAEANAPWRTEAQTRIDNHRKADLNINVVDAAGLPVPNAQVDVAMQEHEFGFGTAVQAWRLRDNQPQHDTYKAHLTANFNTATLENNLKWPPWEGEWGTLFSQSGAVNALDWLNTNGFKTRGHVMVWPGYDNLPADIKTMLDDGNLTPAEQVTVRTRIENHITSLAAATNGRIDEWDVVNETRTNHDLMDQLSEGDMAIVDWFQHAEDEAPSADRYINDYGILASGGNTSSSNQNIYYNTIETLLNENAAIDGIGFQAHFFEGNLTGPEQVWDILDRFDQLGLKMQITEFDFTTQDEQLQAEFTKDFLIAAFAHEGVDDFIQWGFWEDAHWRPDAALFRSDWSIKPNGQAYLDLVFDEWWTDENLVADSEGTAQTRGFKGSYQVTATFGDESQAVPVILTGTESSMTVAIASIVGDYNNDGTVNSADYTVWRDSYGSTTELAADGNNDGVINLADLDVWKSRFGVSLSSTSSNPVPEPTSLMMLLLCSWAITFKHRSK